jgi:hypothetical protein
LAIWDCGLFIFVGQFGLRMYYGCSMENIAALAKENIPELLKKYDIFIDGYELREFLDGFVNHIKPNLSISMNFKLVSLFNFLQDGYYKNIYEIYANDYDQLEKNNPLFFYRFSFDFSFENGKDFKYGALNSGNIGTKFWGDFCIYLKSKEMDSTVLIKHNSLSKEPNGKYRYFSQEKNLLLDKLKNDLSNFENAILLVVLKNKDQDYSKSSVNEYNDLVNDGDSEYVEAIMDFKLTLEMVSKITVEDEIYDKYLDNNVESRENKNEQIIFTKVMKEAKSKNISLIPLENL